MREPARTFTFALFVCWALFAGQVLACSIPPQEASVSLRELVDRTKRVVVGDVTNIAVQSDTAVVTVNVVEQLKGTTPKVLKMQIPASGIADVEQDFVRELVGDTKYSHSKAHFWLGRWVAGGIDPMCRVVFNPEAGKRYLIFLDRPYHVRGFEPITGPEDTWYRAVRQIISNLRAKGYVVSPSQFLAMFDSIYETSCGGLPDFSVRPPRWIAGRRFRIDEFKRLSPNPMFDPQPNYCDRWFGRPLKVWVLFAYQRDAIPTAIPIFDGKLTFAPKYGDLVLSARTLVAARPRVH